MTILDTDIKLYNSDNTGIIDLESEIINNTYIFSEVLDADNDIEKKAFVFNNNDTDTLNDVRVYIVNGYTIDNTINTPVLDAKVTANITPDTYTLNFTSYSVVITNDSETLTAQEIIKDDVTFNLIYLRTGQYIFLSFDSALIEGDQTIITISEGGSFLTLSESIQSVPIEYVEARNYSSGVQLDAIEAKTSKEFWIKQSVPDLTATDTYKAVIVVRCR